MIMPFDAVRGVCRAVEDYVRARNGLSGCPINGLAGEYLHWRLSLPLTACRDGEHECRSKHREERCSVDSAQRHSLGPRHASTVAAGAPVLRPSGGPHLISPRFANLMN